MGTKTQNAQEHVRQQRITTNSETILNDKKRKMKQRHHRRCRCRCRPCDRHHLWRRCKRIQILVMLVLCVI